MIKLFLGSKLEEQFVLSAGFYFCAKRGFDIADQRHIDRAMRTNTAGVDINLDDIGVGWIKCTVGELCSQQNQGVGPVGKPGSGPLGGLVSQGLAHVCPGCIQVQGEGTGDGMAGLT